MLPSLPLFQHGEVLRIYCNDHFDVLCNFKVSDEQLCITQHTPEQSPDVTMW